MRAKKHDVVSVKTADGESYRLTIKAIQSSNFGPYDTFQIEFPWGTVLSNESVSELMKLAKVEVEKNGKAVKERIIGVEFDRWDKSSGTMNFDKSNHASLGLSWITGYRSTLADGTVSYFNDAMNRVYDFGHMRVILWTQEREDALRNGVATLNRISDALDKMMKSEDLPARLEKSGGMLALPERTEQVTE